MNQNNHKFIKFSVVMLIINLLIVLVTCIIRKDLSLVSYLHYTFYVGLVNVILGFLVKLGSRENKAFNEVLNHSLTYRKTSEELFKENIINTNKSTYCMLIFEAIGIILVISSSVISKII